MEEFNRLIETIESHKENKSEFSSGVLFGLSLMHEVLSITLDKKEEKKRGQEEGVNITSIVQRQMEELPLILEAKDVAKILKISMPTVYEFMEHKGFPLIRIGRTKRVPKEAFFDWLREQRNE